MLKTVRMVNGDGLVRFVSVGLEASFLKKNKGFKIVTDPTVDKAVVKPSAKMVNSRDPDRKTQERKLKENSQPNEAGGASSGR